MRKIVATIIILVIAVSIGLIKMEIFPYMPSQPTPTGPAYKVYGYITDENGVALAGATITLDGLNTTTDSSGYYELEVQNGAQYTIEIIASGYEPYTASVAIENENVRLDVALKTTEVALPTNELKNIIATNEDTSTENVKIQFIVQVERENYAFGAVVNNQKSLVGFYSSGKLNLKEEYEPITTDEINAAHTLAIKNPISKFTGNGIVPFNIYKQDNYFSFNYYDGYDSLLHKWGHGTAIIDAEGNIPEENMTHSWI